MRVKDLQDILTSLRMPKSGRKDELVKRLKDMCRSSILVHAAGGRQHVEHVISASYANWAGIGMTGGGGGGVRRSPGMGTTTPKRKRVETESELAALAAAAGLGGGYHGNFGATPAVPHLVDHGVWARAVAADPFWASADEPKLSGTPGVVMTPMRLRSQPGTHVQFLERPFQITPAQAKLLRNQHKTYELQLQCLLIDDPVLARLHWPFLVRKD